MAASDLEQWVNLDQRASFVEDDVKSLDRVGPEIVFTCSFAKAKQANFKVRIVSQSSPASYTKKELGRNAHFKLRTTGAYSLPNGNGLLNYHELPCAGGNRFKIEAKYKDKVVTSPHVLATRRRLFYQVLSMAGVAPQPVSGMEQDFWSPSKNYYIKLVEKGPKNTIKLIKTVHEDNYDDFIRAAKAGYTIDNRRPYAFALVNSHFIASWIKYRHREEVDLSLRSRIVRAISPTKVRVKVQEFIWYEMDPAHDKADFWLVSNSTQFVPDGGTPVAIHRDAIKVVGPPQYPLGGYSWLEITLPSSLGKVWSSQKGKLRIDLELRCVEGWSGGLSFNDLNLITVGSISWWNPSSTSELAQILNHELGHKIGMVASGMDGQPNGPLTMGGQPHNRPVKFGGQPNGPPTLYGARPGDERTHRGPHCSKGMIWTPIATGGGTWAGVPGCVMFGATAAESGGTIHYSPATFCPECEKIVRKLDLDGHFLEGLRNSIAQY